MADVLLARSGDENLGLQFEGRRWSWKEVLSESRIRALAAQQLRKPGPFHIGVLLENVPEYLFWLGGAVLGGAVVVGINPTRRGAELAQDIRFTECQLVVTDSAGLEILSGLDIGLGDDRILLVDETPYAEVIGAIDSSLPKGNLNPLPEVTAETLLLLLFTSGTTAAPKAVRCTQGRLASIAVRAAGGGFRSKDICYCPMPLFHGNAIMALWAPAVAAGASFVLPRRFSASRFIDDVRSSGATRFTYVGKALSYILATPSRADDFENPLKLGFGTEASAPDRARFEERFGCKLVEGYGSSEGGAAITVTPDTPVGSLGRSLDDVAVYDPESLVECPPAHFDEEGRFTNAHEAIGEIVNRSGTKGFEGYYNNPEADSERARNGWYWTGDLGYRDEKGFFYFAGRGATGCASTRRTSRPHRSSASSNDIPTYKAPSSMPFPTPGPEIRSWLRSSSAQMLSSTRSNSRASSNPSTTSVRSGRPGLSGSRETCPLRRQAN